MFKKIYNYLISMQALVVLSVLFATAMAVATFVEKYHGTQTARTLFYNSFWFELIMILLAVNLVGNIIRFKMYQPKKWPIFLFHASFLLILIGAGITRYISFEGMMPIREGETTDLFLSDKIYLKVEIDDGVNRIVPPVLKKLDLSDIDVPLLTDNHYRTSLVFQSGKKKIPVEIEIIEFIPHATDSIITGSGNDNYLKLVVSTRQGRRDVWLKEGQRIDINGKILSYNQPQDKAVNIISKDNKLQLLSPYPGTWMRMSDQQITAVQSDSLQDLQTASLYQFDNLNFVVPQAPIQGKKVYYATRNENLPDLIRVKFTSGQQSKMVDLHGGQFRSEDPKIFQLNGLNYRANFGSIPHKLPFQIKLRDFQLEKYPGSEMPKSYASEVTVIDTDKSFDFRIFMNHVLDYKGYRFYQSSYTITPQYEETQLSVNHDFWGTWITYIGYALLYFGLLMIFIVKGTRFYKLRQMLKKIQNQRKNIGIFLLFLIGFSGIAQEKQEISIDSIVIKTVAPVKQAENFGHLVIQDYGGRMKPVNTYASELLRKLSKHDTYTLKNGQSFTADQVLTGMISYPQGWWYVPVIYMERGDEKLREIIGVDKNQKYARLIDFFDKQANYKLQKYIEEAQKKRIKGKFDKDIINVSGRVNLLYNTLMGENLRLFPLPGDSNHKWYSWTQIDKYQFDEKDKNFAKTAIPVWSKEIFKAKTTGDFKLADDILKGIATYQKKFGKAVYPSERKIKMETFYNKYDAFRSLFWQFMTLSLFIFILAIAQIFTRNKMITYGIKFLYIVSLLLFIWMLIFMGLRWYISGHAPWSNAYESMIYVSFAIILFSLILGRKSALTLSAGLFVGSMTLMIAHWNWMDPEIENLVPVLNSYWLDIHVSIIVASYGPFAIGMILGLVSLLLMALINEKNKDRLTSYIDELSIITEMALIIGLVMLTIGNFLGGQWANESWGRYWGWDPKETWALISIVVYALVLHVRFIPGLRGKFTFNLLAVISFASILMTYFGVNFYLAGLHSYAKGEASKTPVFMYYFVAGIFIIAVIAYYKYKKYLKTK